MEKTQERAKKRARSLTWEANARALVHAQTQARQRVPFPFTELLPEMQREVAQWICHFDDMCSCMRVSKSLSRLILDAQAARWYASFQEARTWVEKTNWAAIEARERSTINDFRHFWPHSLNTSFDDYLCLNFHRGAVSALTVLDPKGTLDYRIRRRWVPWVRLVRADLGVGVNLAQLVFSLVLAGLSPLRSKLLIRLIDKWTTEDLSGSMAILLTSLKDIYPHIEVDNIRCIVAYVLFRYILKYPIGSDFFEMCGSYGVFRFFTTVTADYFGLSPYMKHVPCTLLGICQVAYEFVLRYLPSSLVSLNFIQRFIQMVEDRQSFSSNE